MSIDTKALRERSEIALRCLPEAPYREQLSRLHTDMLDRVAALEAMCAQVYQAAGAYDMPERVLDVLSDAASGDPIRHANILPVDLPEHEQRILRLQRDNASLRETLADYHAQHKCGCGHPACNRCAEDRLVREVLATGGGS